VFIVQYVFNISFRSARGYYVSALNNLQQIDSIIFYIKQFHRQSKIITRNITNTKPYKVRLTFRPDLKGGAFEARPA